MIARFFVLIPFALAACTDSPRGGDAAGENALGVRTYNTTCITCHQSEGQGVQGIYPPLTQSEWVNGDEGRLIRLVLNGMRGPIEVDGVRYNSVMTAHRFLNDDQIAAVLTYVRSNFGNDSAPVRPEDVAAVRAATDRREMWTVEELEPLTGIPGR